MSLTVLSTYYYSCDLFIIYLFLISICRWQCLAHIVLYVYGSMCVEIAKTMISQCDSCSVLVNGNALFQKTYSRPCNNIQRVISDCIVVISWFVVSGRISLAGSSTCCPIQCLHDFCYILHATDVIIMWHVTVSFYKMVRHWQCSVHTHCNLSVLY